MKSVGNKLANSLLEATASNSDRIDNHTDMSITTHCYYYILLLLHILLVLLLMVAGKQFTGGNGN